MMTVVSSAKRIENKRLDALEKSSINAIKKRGPWIEHWGIPCIINFVSDMQVINLTIQSSLLS